MTDTVIKETKLHDITHFGIRAAIGAIFIYHGVAKFNNQEFLGALSAWGLAPELALPVALAESIGGILLVLGLLTRISSSILAVDMLGAIFVVKKLKSFSGQGGWEFDLILLAALLVIIVTGPGRVSVSQVVKRVPRFLQ